MPALKIAVLTQYFPPDSHGWISAAVATGMQRRGHDVKVLTTFPHYDTGRVADGYRQSRNHTETYGDIPVKRVPLFASHSRNPIGRIANYLSFAVSARINDHWVKDVDVVYVYGSPATTTEVARSLFKRYGIPYVYHVVDIWPESVTESGFLPQKVLDVMRLGLNKWLSKVYASAAAVISIAPTAKAILEQRGVPAERAHLVYNWSEPVVPAERQPNKGLTLLYAGNLGDFQDLDTVIQAASSMIGYPDFRVRIAGSGLAEERLRKLVTSLGLQEVVEFLGRVDKSKMPQLYAEADFQIVSLKDLDFFAGTIPSKLQMGFAHGTPVITTVRGDVSTLVAQNRLGMVAKAEDVQSLAAAYKTAYEMSADERSAYVVNALQFFESNFTEQIAMDQIESILLEASSSVCNRDRKQ